MKKWMKITLPIVSAAVVTMAVPVCVYTVPKLFDKYQVEEPVRTESVNTSSINAEGASEIVSSVMKSAAQSYTENTSKATQIKMTDSNSQVEISDAGTYIVSGSCSNGNITVKKGTTNVVLILKDLTLTSKTGATVSINKESSVKMIIEGEVTLTDSENPEDENSTDAETADAFDGAAIKVKAGADLYLTGDGTLNINGECKNGIKTADDTSTVCIIDGPAINITAVNDAINAGYDLTIQSGTITVNAGDDAIHADRILTVGSENGSPVIRVEKCEEGLEGTVVNIVNGDIEVNSNDDAVNAANSDGTYASEMSYSINVTGGTTVINSNGDGLDSNGNINLIGGSLTINCRNNGGEGGLDYQGTYYISDEMELNNNGGVTMDSGTGGMGGGRPGMEQFGKGQFGDGQFEKGQFEKGQRGREQFEDGQSGEGTFGKGQFGDGQLKGGPRGNGQRPEKPAFGEDGQVPEKPEFNKNETQSEM